MVVTWLRDYSQWYSAVHPEACSITKASNVAALATFAGSIELFTAVSLLLNTVWHLTLRYRQKIELLSVVIIAGPSRGQSRQSEYTH